MSSDVLRMILLFMVVYTLVNFFFNRRRNSGTNYLQDMLNNFEEEDKFFESAKQALENEKNETILERAKVLKLWGEAQYGRDEDFKETLKTINLEGFVTAKKRMRVSPVEENDDVLYYLYLVIPNILQSKNKPELQKALDEALQPIEEAVSNTLVKKISVENQKYYAGNYEEPKAFYEKIMEGEYAEYTYSKRMIGYYKQRVIAMLASIYQKEGNTEKYNEYLSELKDLAKVPSGKRWLEEIHLEVPVEEEEKEEPVEDEQVEETSEEEVTQEENKEEEKTEE